MVRHTISSLDLELRYADIITVSTVCCLLSNVANTQSVKQTMDDVIVPLDLVVNLASNHVYNLSLPRTKIIS